VGLGRNVTAPTAISNTTTVIEAAGATTADGISSGPGGTISNAPIAPEASSGGKLVRFLLLVLAAGALYFFLHHR
jgi:hypothetical protein